MGTLGVLLKKELIQFKRNSFLPKLVIAFPIIIMLVMPWVTQLDVKNIRITIIDEDNSSFSRRAISHIKSSSYFVCDESYADYQSAVIAMDGNQLDVIVSIPKDFEQNLQKGIIKPILIESNGVNAVKGQQGIQYVVQNVAKTISEIQSEMGAQLLSDTIVVQNRYNETQNAMFYMIPALMIILILLMCGFLPTLNIVQEKESGTIEQINVTPVGRFEFIIAKLIPYWILGEFVFFEAMLLAWLVYGLAPAGSLWTIFGASVLFVVVMSGLGVTIANVSDNMQQSVFLIFFFLMIFMLLSGLLTPVSSMPDSVRWISYLCPPRYFISIMRAVYLKGTTFMELWFDFAALGALSIFFTITSTISYHKQN